MTVLIHSAIAMILMLLITAVTTVPEMGLVIGGSAYVIREAAQRWIIKKGYGTLAWAVPLLAVVVMYWFSPHWFYVFNKCAAFSYVVQPCS